MEKSLFILVGTYEELLFGYRCDFSDSGNEIKPIFTDHSHSKSIRSVAISSSGRYFASGSTDETFQLFSHLFSRPRSIGNVHAHESAVSSLRFIDDDRLISVEDGGSMSIWKSTDWESPIHSFPKTHKRCAPSDLAIHPSGRLALTIGQDRTMRTWDFVHLRQAACVPCSKNDQQVVSVFWSKSGQSYGVLYTRELEIYSTSDCQKMISNPFDSTATCAAFICEGDFAVVGFQNGKISGFETKANTNWTILDPSTENGRVKALSVIDLTADTGLITSGSSTGWIRVFRYWRSGKKFDVEEVASINIGARITCMAVKWSAEDESGRANGKKVKRKNFEKTNEGDETERKEKGKKRQLETNDQEGTERRLKGKKKVKISQDK